MKKILAIIFLFTITSQVFSQLNPIEQIHFESHYASGSFCPTYTCFSLHWDGPEFSDNDTLVGYNIYRNSDLWHFHIDGNIGCGEYDPDCSYDDFWDYADQFWIKVKVVYNYNHLESEAIDSVLCLGPMTHLKKKNHFRILSIQILQKEVSL